MSIHFDPTGARVKKYTVTSGSGGKSLVRIEIEATSPWELADIVRQLQEQAAPAPRARRPVAPAGGAE